MQKLFENWRRFVNEASQLTIDRDIFIKKVMDFIKQQGMDAEEPRYPQDVTGGEAIQDIFYMLNKKSIVPVGLNIKRSSLPKDFDEEQFEKFRILLTEFAKARGWNLLDPQFNEEYISLKFDSDRGDSTTYFTVRELLSLADIDKYYLYHITSVDTAKKILKDGIKPAKISADGIYFGNGRAYYFIGIRPPEDLILALDPMQGAEIASGASGLKTVLRIDPAKIPNKNIKFTIDTEFDDVDAVWTQSHIPQAGDDKSPAIIELAEFRQTEQTFQDNPEDDL